MKKYTFYVVALGLLLAAGACSPKLNTLSGTEQKAGWKLLFDGKMH